MIVDSSALVAIVFDEPGQSDLVACARTADSLTIGAPNLVETFMVVDGRNNPTLSRKLDALLEDLLVEVAPFTAQHARRAREAYREYGRGSGHPARLNYGDCCAYAVASVARQPLLFVGDNFRHTDVEAAC